MSNENKEQICTCGTCQNCVDAEVVVKSPINLKISNTELSRRMKKYGMDHEFIKRIADEIFQKSRIFGEKQGVDISYEIMRHEFWLSDLHEILNSKRIAEQREFITPEKMKEFKAQLLERQAKGRTNSTKTAKPKSDKPIKVKSLLYKGATSEERDIVKAISMAANANFDYTMLLPQLKKAHPTVDVDLLLKRMNLPSESATS